MSWWDEKEMVYRCPECKSTHVYHYFERVCIYDWEDELVGFKDWSDSQWNGFRCDDCGEEYF